MESIKIWVAILIFTFLLNEGNGKNLNHKYNAEITDKHLLTCKSTTKYMLLYIKKRFKIIFHGTKYVELIAMNSVTNSNYSNDMVLVLGRRKMLKFKNTNHT